MAIVSLHGIRNLRHFILIEFRLSECVYPSALNGHSLVYFIENITQKENIKQ